jgi:hypothetical protein
LTGGGPHETFQAMTPRKNPRPARQERRPQPRRPQKSAESSLRFDRTNGILAAAGVLTIALGYFLLSQGSITAAPLLLVLGYVVLLPLAIIR